MVKEEVAVVLTVVVEDADVVYDSVDVVRASQMSSQNSYPSCTPLPRSYSFVLSKNLMEPPSRVKTQLPKVEVLARMSIVLCGWTETIDAAASKHNAFLISVVLPLTTWKYHIWQMSG
jgi:hypothetical protein